MGKRVQAIRSLIILASVVGIAVAAGQLWGGWAALFATSVSVLLCILNAIRASRPENIEGA